MNFQTQSESWLAGLASRKKSPVKASSLVQFRSFLRRLNPLIGGAELESINNRSLRELVGQLRGSPKTLQCYLGVVKAVVASVLDEDGQPVYDRKWNSDFIDAPQVDKQKQPAFTSEQVSDIVSRANGTALLCKLAAGSGMRVGELLALDATDFNGRTLKVSKNLSQQGAIGTPKTSNGFREVDLSVSLAEEVSGYLRGRVNGFLFEEPRTYSTALNSLHSVLDDLKIEHTGFHAFRRYRITHLGKSKVPNELVRFWVGHAKPDVTARYDAVHKDIEFRLSEAERVKEGF